VSDRRLTLAALAAASADITATRSRTAKTERIATLLADAHPDDLALAVLYLSGVTRQGRIGVGWATLADVAVRPEATSPSVPAMTLGEVDALLDAVEATTGQGSAERRQQLLQDRFAALSATEADLLQRLLLGELRQGANEGVVLDGLARATGVAPTALRRALMLSGDLATAARAAHAGVEAIAAVGLEVGRPIRPMLAATASDVATAVDELGMASVEWKLDGARIQVHRWGDEVRIWTRNLNEVTGRLPGVEAAVRSLPCEAIVLDGEVLGISEDERPERFQDTMRSFGSDGAAVSLAPMFFDIMHLDGVDLVDAPLGERLDRLDAVVGRLRIPGLRTDDAAAATDVLEQALAAGHEGVMVKALDGPYEAGRRGKSWRKVKPVHTLDLVVLAVEWGSGRRQGLLSNLHLGARGPDGEMVMVGKTFKGLTDEMLAWQTRRFLELETGRRRHIVDVAPVQVVEIALDGVQRSTRYPGGVALRFARVRRYRDDKAAADADTIESVQAMLG
jgi:DNA ligase-1